MLGDASWLSEWRREEEEEEQQQQQQQITCSTNTLEYALILLKCMENEQVYMNIIPLI